MSNSNIERFLDYLLRVNGEKLVINTKEPLFILKAENKISLLNRVLTAGEFQAVEAEYKRIFANGEAIAFKGKTIYSRKSPGQVEFFFSPAPAAPSPPVSSTPSPPPVPSPAAAPETVEASPQGKGLDLDELLRLMVQENASDLHLSSKCKPAMRIDGDMVTLEDFPPISSDELFKELERITYKRNIKEFQEIHDTDFAYSIEGVARFRVNMFRDIRGVGAVFRIIPSKILTVEDLNIPRAIVDLCNIPKGLILVTGPTGSGKSTTLAALINRINETQRKHIITIEDPVEFVHPNKLSLVNQREVHTHTQSFKRALRAALREDPDIILVGEMRDLETIAIAIEMAVTGHLVFGTLHTATAIGTIDRIIDQFPSGQQSQIKTMLADALIGVIAHTLLKKKEKGRVAAFEVLVVTAAVSNLIREGKNYQIATLMQTGKALGMQLINNHLAELVEKRIVDTGEAISKAIDQEGLKTILKGKGLL
jgi:twitching motility protein PilT